MKVKRSLACALPVLVLSLPMAHGMGLRSFVALPVEKGGAVLRAAIEHNADTDNNLSMVSVAYGVSHRQTFLFGVPYHLFGPR